MNSFIIAVILIVIQQGGDIMKGLTGRKAIKLKMRDKREIEKVLRSKQPLLRVYKRARVLKSVSSGQSVSKAAVQVGVSYPTAWRICSRYKEEGIGAIYDRVRCGRPLKFSQKESQRAVAMICSKPPEGLSRWTIRVIVCELERRGITGKISRHSVWLLLQSHKLKPWREKNVVYR